LANEKFAGITPMMVLGSTFPPKSATRNRFPNTSGAPPKRPLPQVEADEHDAVGIGVVLVLREPASHHRPGAHGHRRSIAEHLAREPLRSGGLSVSRIGYIPLDTDVAARPCS
jgi:hypothetical protein